MSEIRNDVVQIDGQQVELLPARTVLSTFARAADEGNGNAGALDSIVGDLSLVDNVAPASGGDPGTSGTAGGATKGI
jgi:hypothetical protein